MRFRKGVKIYLDDTRITPRGWLRAYSYEDAIKLLKANKGRVKHMSFDHDLGLKDNPMDWTDLAPTGYDVLCWIEKQVALGDKKIAPEKMSVHSSNPGVQVKMQQAIRSIERFRR